MLQDDKLRLIDATADLELETIVDLGGMWMVEGGYLAYAAGNHEARGIEVDFNAEMPGFETYRGDFTGWLENRSNLDGWARFDCALLFDVLLHQECPMRVLKNVTERTRKAILISQPCLTDHRPISVNLQFGLGIELRYELSRHDVHRREHGCPKRWTTAAWGWGQSQAWITAAMAGFGWEPQYSARETMKSQVWTRSSVMFVPES
jgi:hypothetical protein